jgi:phage-related holin
MEGVNNLEARTMGISGYFRNIKVEIIENNSHLGLSLPTSHKSPTCQPRSIRFG